MAIYMQTTKIDTAKTASEISNLLAEANARQVVTDYKERRPVSLTFVMDVDGAELGFRLPVRAEAIFRLLQKQRSPTRRQYAEKDDLAQAERVAWRQVLRWVQAQLALIETGMVKTEEVFMPYVRLNTDQTMYEAFAERHFRALPSEVDK